LRTLRPKITFATLPLSAYAQRVSCRFDGRERGVAIAV
jgi:hypothetical protein